MALCLLYSFAVLWAYARAGFEVGQVVAQPPPSHVEVFMYRFDVFQGVGGRAAVTFSGPLIPWRKVFGPDTTSDNLGGVCHNQINLTRGTSQESQSQKV